MFSLHIALILPFVSIFLTTGDSIPVSPGCVTSCYGVNDGNYASCYGCRFYVTCAMGLTFDRRLCPRGLYWDDVLKQCLPSSQTCSPEVIPCVSVCSTKPDGTYHSCKGCSVFVTCRSDRIYDNQPCPRKLQWDDHKKRCIRKSTTCKSVINPQKSSIPIVNLSAFQNMDPSQGGPVERLNAVQGLSSKVKRPRNLQDPTTNSTKSDDKNGEKINDGKRKSGKNVMLLLGSDVELRINGTLGDGDCIRRCRGLPDGNYQSCHGCIYYASCKNGKKTDKRLCAEGTSWDNNVKACVSHSTTCHTMSGKGPKRPTTGTCVTECIGIEDGQYQSCKGCDFVVNCWEESFEELSCLRTGSGLYWDDKAKLCLADSSTCNPGKVKSLSTTDEGDVSRHVVLPGTCISTCDGVEDGNYQSCISCRVFVTCKNGLLFDGRSCIQNQLWDDRLKQCAPTSSTCKVSSGTCVHSCKGLSNGNYPSCRGCHLFVSCTDGALLEERSCPGQLVWDDDLKLCVPFSSTCNYGKRQGPPEGEGKVTEIENSGRTIPPTIPSTKITPPLPPTTTTKRETTTTATTSTSSTTPKTTSISKKSTRAAPTYKPILSTLSPKEVLETEEGNSTDINGTSPGVKTSCIGSCEDLPDGDYQSCYGCTVYITCSGGKLYTRSCPNGLKWDDIQKKCEAESVTCGPGFGECVQECGSLWDGDYQSCKGCKLYVTCSNGVAHDQRRCPGGLMWDDLLKWCVTKSSTCSDDGLSNPGCVTSCEGLKDGNYQSCKGCKVHVTCSNGELQDTRPCPEELVFDAIESRCMEKSNTCGPGRGECIQTCEGLPNGDYMSCKGCSVYATCIDGVIHDSRPCQNNMKWDDLRKRCSWEPSIQCLSENQESGSNGNVSLNKTSGDEPPNLGKDLNVTYEGHIGDGVCISTCQGQLNGDYQSCQGCDVFATCLNGVLYDRRPCPDGLIWEDTIKHCMSTSTTCGPGRGGCVSSCEGLNDGEYQSCRGCNIYVSCLNGAMEDDRPCPRGELWDDQKKRCERSSNTCAGTHKSSVQAGVCVYECEGIPDGEYQSCYGCTGYATCTSGVIRDSRPCPIGLVWDDIKKRCRYNSPTCGPGRGECTRSCDGLPDGNFQSCSSCRVYATCMDGVLHDDRPCPGRLVWDDTTKRCMRTSQTCGFRGRNHQNGASRIDPALELARVMGSSVRSFSPNCVSSCDGLADGNYQSCHDCRVYVTCSDGNLNDDRACPISTLWDDNQKRCLRTSSTCSTVIYLGGGGGSSRRESQQPRTRHHHYSPPPRHTHHQRQSQSQRQSGPRGNCISDCNDRSNGDYQSCLDCRVFATCLHGVLHDNRPCPVHTLWDDRKKRCMYESDTCYIPGFGRPTSPPRRVIPVRHRTHRRRGHYRNQARTRTVGVGECLDSCSGVRDGNYQSCRGCTVFTSCIRGRFYDNRHCPSNLVWNDEIRRCDFTSETCTSY